ncbi:MAG: diaminopimelate epimerase [Candidatus Omnitrophica bacterium]|nr:diaminopimelate epimerase [Candidatus Omnitrophota bacterium]
MKQVEFVKMVASGNDFVIVDGAKGSMVSKFAKEICDRKYGAGADGLIILEKSKKADFKMRIFNPDGSEPSMCGNGARCAALFFVQSPKSKVTSHKIKFETKAGIIEAEVNRNVIRLKMPNPRDIWVNIDLNIGSQFYKVHYINTGVPHAVFFVGNCDTINVREVGRQIRYHKQFQPEGANADFAQIINDKTLKIRTYERGVEDETLACGTGSVASALLAHYLKLTKKSPVAVETRGGEVLKVYFDFKDDRFSDVWLEGSAAIAYKGIYFPAEGRK